MRRSLGSLAGSSLGDTHEAPSRSRRGTIRADQLFDSYGARAARILMQAASGQPPDKRTAFLKAAMDKIDPTIWSRAEGYANEAVGRGVPPATAVEAGIARAMSRGIVNELVELGKRTVCRPIRRPDGSVSWRCSGVNAVPSVNRRSQIGLGAFGQTEGPPRSPDASDCLNPPTGYTWTGTAWARVKAGSTTPPVPHPTPGCYTVAGGGRPSGGVTVTGGGQPFRPFRPGTPSAPMMSIGPWQVPVDAVNAVFDMTGGVRDHRGVATPDYGGISSAWKKKIGDEIARQFQFQLYFAFAAGRAGSLGVCIAAPQLIPASDFGITVPPLLKTLMKPGDPISPDLNIQPNLSQSEIDSSESIYAYAGTKICDGPFNTEGNRSRWPSALYSGGWVPARFLGYLKFESTPLFRVKHPVTGEDYGLFMQASPIEGGQPELAPSQGRVGVLRLDTNSAGSFLHAGGPLRFVYRKIRVEEKSRWAKFWDFIAAIPAILFRPALDALAEVAEDIAELACEVINNPLAATGATVGATAAGAPPAAGAGGVAVAQRLCADPTPPPPPPVDDGGSITPILIAGGAGLLLLLLATRRSSPSPRASVPASTRPASTRRLSSVRKK